MSRGRTQPLDEEAVGDPSGSLEACTFSQPDDAPPRYRIVGPDGTYDPEAAPDLDVQTYRELFSWMVTQQVVDERMVK
ncbi:MAG: hypothetical protein ABEH59_03335, partial [Halobacteriales archaeon]